MTGRAASPLNLCAGIKACSVALQSQTAQQALCRARQQGGHAAEPHWAPQTLLALAEGKWNEQSCCCIAPVLTSFIAQSEKALMQASSD